jgi:diguanylate cyclase (GGDEF)-like protein
MNPKGYKFDALTNLLNRNAFHEQFEATMRKAKASEQPFSLAFVDIDGFMRVNETIGHKDGDLVLQSVVTAIREIVNDKAIIARYGGDDFALLFPNKERESSLLMLERVRESVENRQKFEGVETTFETQVTLSAGIASYPVDARSETELLRKADQAMYQAKEKGGNQVRLAYEERLVPRTTHYTQTQLERLSRLSEKEGVGEAVLLREALDNLLLKYRVTEIES